LARLLTEAACGFLLRQLMEEGALLPLTVVVLVVYTNLFID
jgi:hypothetical protein